MPFLHVPRRSLCFQNLIHQKSQFFSYLAENKPVRCVPWLLNFNGFREKLICRIKARLSRGFPLSEHQPLRIRAESANEEQDASRGSACHSGTQLRIPNLWVRAQKRHVLRSASSCFLSKSTASLSPEPPAL